MTPLLREGTAIGVINIRRTEVKPFTDKQVTLLETFASQAVIAIENVRLFQELEARTRQLAPQSVGELKALGEVGQAVSSTLDLQKAQCLAPLLAGRFKLSGTDCRFFVSSTNTTRPRRSFIFAASYLMEQELVDAYQATPLRLGQGATGIEPPKREYRTKLPTFAKSTNSLPEGCDPSCLPGLATDHFLAVPLLFEQKIMEALTIYRRETGSFAPGVVNLLRTFATQSVLAIQNARLFREIEEDKSSDRGR